MALEIDLESEVTLQFMRELGQIPASVLLARHQEIEHHLAARDKWLNVARWWGVISAAVIMLSDEVVNNENLSSWIKICTSLVIAGFGIGAILVHAGSSELKQLSFVLKKMGERLQADDVRRKRRRGR